jgi:hypothetical protein
MDPKEDYYRLQNEKINRGYEDFRFPIAAELATKWEKEEIPLGTLMERDDLQLYTGKPWEWAYHVWKQTGTTQANEIGKHWDTIIRYLPNNEEINKHLSNINGDLAKLVIYNQEESNDYPIFIIENKHFLPYTTGSIIDGNHRLIALLKELRDGNIQESTPIQVWKGQIPTFLVALYNVATFTLDKKPLRERILLLKERAKPQERLP